MLFKSRGKIWSSPIGGEYEEARESQSFEQEAQSESQFTITKIVKKPSSI